MKSDYGCLYHTKVSPSSPFHPYTRPADGIVEDSKTRYSKDFGKNIKNDLAATVSQINIPPKPLVKPPSAVSISVISLTAVI